MSVGVCVDADLTTEAVAKHARDFRLNFPVVQDRDGSIAARFGAKVTPEAFVYDAAKKLRYRGRIDDQFAARGKRNAHSATHELGDAIAAVLGGREVAQAEVEAVGCPVSDPARSTRQADLHPRRRPPFFGPTASSATDPARWVRSRWKPSSRHASGRPTSPRWTHRPPHASLETRRRLRPGSEALESLDRRRDRPPAEVGRDRRDRRQTPPDLAPAPVFSNDWTLGTPDLVIQTPEDFEIPAQGEDIYRCFVIPTDLPDDKYISAIEYHPGNRKIVHHVLGYVDITGGARIKDQREPGVGYMCFSGPGVPTHGDLGGWAPGSEPSFLPDGVGRSLPKKADVVVQVHYHPSGKPETDRTTVGLYFSKKPVRQTLHWNAALNLGMKLPAGQSNTEIKANWPVPVDVTALGIAPHMHLLGHDMTMTATLPDGRNLDLIRINDWDFDWQNNYWFDQPIDLPKGSTLRVVAHFNNSADNPHNPKNPPVDVKWGEGTTDEMCIGFLAMVKKGQDLTKPGEKDDLNLIFQRQGEERIKNYEKRQRQAAEEARRAGQRRAMTNRRSPINGF